MRWLSFHTVEHILEQNYWTEIDETNFKNFLRIAIRKQNVIRTDNGT